MSDKTPANPLPLAGLRVLELGRLIAAPLVAQLLGDLGAEVIKVERPVEGDDFRRYGAASLRDAEGKPTVETAAYTSVNRNKRSITCDISKPEGQEIIRGLARRCDVMIENFKVGGLTQYGLDYASVRAEHPGVIYLSMTGFGQTGPYAPMAGTDSAFQAMSGFMSVTGEPDAEPMKVGTYAIDNYAGLYGAFAVMAALRHRDQTGEGQHIDLALLDCGIAAMAQRSCDYLVGGVTPARVGNRTPGASPGQPFRCADGYLFVQAGSDRLFKILCRVLDRPDLFEDPRYQTQRSRWEHNAALVEALEQSFAARTIKEWFDVLGAAGLITAPIYDVAQCFEDPHVQARGLRVSVPHPLGPLDLVANPIRFSATPIETYRAPPMLGEGTEELLAELLDYDPDKIAGLRAAGAI